MTSQLIELSVANGIATLALNRPEKRNAMSDAMRSEFIAALEHVSEGIAVFDKELQLVCWNRTFGEILDLPRDMIGIGTRLDEILRLHAERGVYGAGYRPVGPRSREMAVGLLASKRGALAWQSAAAL